MTDIIDVTLRPGCAIRKIRQDKEWTIKQLAKKSGVHHNQVANVELRNTGGWATIIALLQALGVTLSIEQEEACRSLQTRYQQSRRPHF